MLSVKHWLNLCKQPLALLPNCLPAGCVGRGLVRTNPLAWARVTHVTMCLSACVCMWLDKKLESSRGWWMKPCNRFKGYRAIDGAAQQQPDLTSHWKRFSFWSFFLMLYRQLNWPYITAVCRIGPQGSASELCKLMMLFQDWAPPKGFSEKLQVVAGLGHQLSSTSFTRSAPTVEWCLLMSWVFLPEVYVASLDGIT